ncbi:MAG: FtsX-like permease family protein, partial [Candidatus Bathyarchaeia archaeon]
QKIFSYALQGWNVMMVGLMFIIVLSILNLMLGTFITRKRDIQIYSTLGLSPGRIMIIFLIESITLGFGGTIIGYLVGFALNQIFVSMGMLPTSFVFNFISLSVVISMSAIVSTVILASLYPALLAAKIVTPSLERRWRAATKPRGDVWELPLPLKAKEFEAVGILRFFYEYFTGAGAARSGFRILNTPQINVKEMEIFFDVILTPVETNITQTATIKGREKEEEGEYHFTLILKRNTGPPGLWESRNRAFIDDIRKQCLIWKGLLPDQRKVYISAMQE